MSDKILDPSEPLDYRYGGETWDTFALKYLQTIPYIFRVLNAINGTDDTGVVLPLPSGAGALVRKNADGTVTVNVVGNASTSDKLSTPRTISLTGKAQGSVSFDGSSNVSLNVTGVTGNAEAISSKPVDITNIADGTIPVYRAASDKFVLESKGTVGAGQTLTIKYGNTVLGTFSGDVACTVDIAPSVEQASSSGNSATATKLQTARSINGTAFDGTGNITTATWGTARNISIQDADASHTGMATSVNGSSTVNLKLPSTIKAGIIGNVTGNVTGSSGSCTGNAATATNAGYANSAGSAGSCTGNAATATTAGNCTGNSGTASKIYGQTVAVVSSYSNGTLALVGLS